MDKFEFVKYEPCGPCAQLDAHIHILDNEY